MLTGCENLPDPIPPPEQRVPIPNFRARRLSHIIRFSEGDMSRVVSDILWPTGGWSWTHKRPAVKILLRGGLSVHYAMEFAIADATFRQTGPVAVTFFVNDHVLDTVRYLEPGPQRFEKAVPPEWVAADNVVGAEVDKVWTSPDDGVQLGLILKSIGLIEQ